MRIPDLIHPRGGASWDGIDGNSHGRTCWRERAKGPRLVSMHFSLDWLRDLPLSDLFDLDWATFSAFCSLQFCNDMGEQLAALGNCCRGANSACPHMQGR